MKNLVKILICTTIIFFTFSSSRLFPNSLHELYTINGIKYKGKFVAFKFNTFYFNVYKFGKVTKKLQIPIHKVWKLIINPHNNNQIISSFELNEKYKNLRKGKKIRKFVLPANQKWLNTNIQVINDQKILFSITGNITIAPNVKVNHGGEKKTKWHKNKPLPTIPTGAVIGKINETGKPFYIGDNKAPFLANSKGILYRTGANR